MGEREREGGGRRDGWSGGGRGRERERERERERRERRENSSFHLPPYF